MVVGDGSMTKDENRVHFGAWCIVSSPLILAFNMSDPARHDLVWDIITNKEAIQINQVRARARVCVCVCVRLICVFDSLRLASVYSRSSWS
jgi:hypothetical protein